MSLFGTTGGFGATGATSTGNAGGSTFGGSLFGGGGSTFGGGSTIGGGGGGSGTAFGASLAPGTAFNASLAPGTVPGAATNAAAAATARPSGAYFDSLLAKSKKRTGNGDAAGGSLMDGSSGDSHGHHGLGLGSVVGNVADLPSLHLGLGDLRQKLRKLGHSGESTGPGGVSASVAGAGASLLDGKAHYVLAASGVDPGAAVRDLGHFSSVAAAAAAAGGAGVTGGGGGSSGGAAGTLGSLGGAPGEVDVDTYLANLQSKTTLSMIADGLERSVRDFDSFLEDNVTMEWEAQRQRIYGHFGIKMMHGVGGGGSGGGGGGSELGGGSGGFGRSRRSRLAAGAKTGGGGGATQGGRGGGSVFGRSRMQRSVIGTPSRIGVHASEFTDVDTSVAGAGGGGGPGNSGGSSGAAGGSGRGGSAASVLDERYTREKQARLAETVHALNDSRAAGVPFPILSEMVAVEQALSGHGGSGGGGDGSVTLVTEAFRALAEIVGETDDAGEADGEAGGRTGPGERAFARAYLDAKGQSAAAVALRQRLLAGANRFLERRFFDEVEAQIARFPQEAQLGGRPDVVSKIKAYIRVRAAHKTLVPDNVELQAVRGEFVWAVIFYLLRTGHVAEAAQYVNDNQTQIRGIDRVFAGYLNSYAASDERRLKRAMQERCQSDYTQRARNAPEGSVDPFRMACYKVVGRCDLGHRSLDGLQTDVHDWIWLQFNLAREGDRAAELASDLYGLPELQAAVRDIGQKHFAKSAPGVAGGTYAMFFYLQVLAGLFEPAIAYLYAFRYVDAVHFAVACGYYGLLRTPDAALAAANELLSHNTRGQPQINFARMMGYYTRDFRAANVAAAVDYLVLIRLGETGAGEGAGVASAGGPAPATALCYEALRELVLETREFSQLIGDIRPDGQRLRGLIEERGPLLALDREQDFVQAITLQAARDADEGGRTTDAVLLYHLAGDYDTVVAIVSRALSEAVALEMGEEPMRLVPVKPRGGGGGGSGQEKDTAAPTSLSLAAMDDPVELARTMLGMYERDNMFRRRISDENRTACGVLLQMSDIKGLVEAGKWTPCLDKIRNLEILPLQANGDPSTVRSYAARFSSLPGPVAANVPNLLMWTILCCTQQRQRLLAGHFSGNESASRLLADQLKQIFVDLTAYTSQLRYRFPPYLHEALARASAD